MVSKVYVGDTGTAIILECDQDISTATARSIEVKKPDGTEVSWTAIANGTTAIQYNTLANTLDIPGKYRLQAKITLPAGVWRGLTVSFMVSNPFT